MLDNINPGCIFVHFILINKHMKKVFTLFAVAGLLFTASCGNKEVQETEEAVEIQVEETEEAIEESVEQLEDTVEAVQEEVEETTEEEVVTP